MGHFCPFLMILTHFNTKNAQKPKKWHGYKVIISSFVNKLQDEAKKNFKKIHFPAFFSVFVKFYAFKSHSLKIP